MSHTDSTSTIPTLETAAKLGLLAQEYERIIEILARQPNFTELSIFSVMWSEHCSYKNSIVWLKTLPKDSERVLAKAGEENAGLIDIGDGWACSFKIESHNHPSALEPFQGAATGVGGINRDIFTMGARPIAQLNSLRFGPPESPSARRHIRGVVAGIAHYGNAFGVPTVGGEVYFDECYTINPLVNAFSAGVVRIDKVARATSYGVGNPVYIIGSATGKDGIHGATFASEDISEKSNAKLPAVQVGDPFQEKLLLEATLELIQTGGLIGIQDMGAAGIICSTSEMSAKGKHGMDIWLDRVPLRQADMQPFEILLSESQERMLAVVEKGFEKQVEDIFAKWDLHCVQIGQVTSGERLHFYKNGDLVADVPADDLVLGGGAPVYHREYSEPDYFAAWQTINTLAQVPAAAADQLPIIAAKLLALPNICSRRWIYQQYDSMVGASTLTTNRPADAAVVRVPETNKALVMSVDCNGRYVRSNPEIGCQIAVAEAARNIVCTGGKPLAITNNLNFGNPYVPQVYWQFVGAIKGMKIACEKFGTPVTGGNVSFYNQSTPKNTAASVDTAVFPTPTIGMLGLIEDISAPHTSLAFEQADDILLLIGHSPENIACSEYLCSIHKIKQTPEPYFDLEQEYQMQEFIALLIEKQLVASAHDISEGGLFVTLAESSMASGLGFKATTSCDYRADAWWFGEAQGRVVVSVRPDKVSELLALQAAQFAHVPCLKIGNVTQEAVFNIDDTDWMSLQKASEIYDNSLEVAIGE